MASSEFVDIAAKGYDFAWKHRKYLLRLAVPVIFIKIVCDLLVFLTATEENVLRSELIYMAAYILQALLLCGLARYIMFREPVYMLSMTHHTVQKNQAPPPAKYNGALSPWQCIQAGTAIYLLFKLILIALNSLNALAVSNNDIENMPILQPTFLSTFTALVFLWAFILVFLWFVRGSWIFLAVSLGYPVSAYLEKVKDTKTAIYIVAVMLMCVLPLDVLTESLKASLAEGLANQKVLQILSISIIGAVGETLILIITTAAMTFGIDQLFHPKEQGKKPR